MCNWNISLDKRARAPWRTIAADQKFVVSKGKFNYFNNHAQNAQLCREASANISGRHHEQYKGALCTMLDRKGERHVSQNQISREKVYVICLTEIQQSCVTLHNRYERFYKNKAKGSCLMKWRITINKEKKTSTRRHHTSTATSSCPSWSTPE